MSNIRLFFSAALSTDMTDKLDKSQSHYLIKVMRVKENEVFSLFNRNGEWEAKVLSISKNIIKFKIQENSGVRGRMLGGPLTIDGWKGVQR